MALAQRLLEQARHLATRDVVGRPRQDHLRRAASTAYFGLFHFLIDQACRFIAPGKDRRALREVLVRAFDHVAMKKASASFASGTLPAKLVPALSGATVPPDLRTIAKTFRFLQEDRHGGDYDLSRRFSRSDVLALITQAEQAIALWPGVQDSRAGQLYLMALLVGERIRD